MIFEKLGYPPKRRIISGKADPSYQPQRSIVGLGVVVCYVFCVAAIAGCAGVTSASKPSNPPSPAVLQITTTSLPGGTDSQAYNAVLMATGGTSPYSWALSAGTLPSGVVLGEPTGHFGNATGSGSFSFRIQVKDSGGQSANASLAIQIASAPPATLQITTSSLPNGTVSQAYGATLAATGGTSPYRENRNGLLVQTFLTEANGRAERDAAILMAEPSPAENG